MAEKPILFSGPMVRAIRAGDKTQTRRVVKLDRNCRWHGPADLDRAWRDPGFGDGEYLQVPCEGTDHYGEATVQRLSCPYGIVGDRFWVKESHYRYGKWIKNGVNTETGRQKWKFIPLISDEQENPIKVFYSENPPAQVKANTYRGPGWYRRSSLFMPRWASRLLLEITAIRPERLQEITRDQAMAEGIERVDPYEIRPNAPAGMPACWKDYQGPGKWIAGDPINSFRSLWDSINGKRIIGKYAWGENPWVWAITFKVL